jgi:hypothetical protein
MAAGCAAQPLPDCRRALRAESGKLSVRDRAPDLKDGINWRWSRGPRTPKADFGDPLTTTAYRFCVYDGTATRVLALEAPAGGICDAKRNKACWRARKRGFSFRQTNPARNGLRSLELREGLKDSAARLSAIGRGPLLALPNPQTLVLPLVVQLQASNGLCFESSYSAPVNRQTAKRFLDQAD